MRLKTHMFVLWDFTKDFKFTTQNEIQSANWNTTYLKTHTTVTCYKKERCRIHQNVVQQRLPIIGQIHLLCKDKYNYLITTQKNLSVCCLVFL